MFACAWGFKRLRKRLLGLLRYAPFPFLSQEKVGIGGILKGFVPILADSCVNRVKFEKFYENRLTDCEIKGKIVIYCLT